MFVKLCFQCTVLLISIQYKYKLFASPSTKSMQNKLPQLSSPTVWRHPASPARGRCRSSGARPADAPPRSPAGRSAGTCTFRPRTPASRPRPRGSSSSTHTSTSSSVKAAAAAASAASSDWSRCSGSESQPSYSLSLWGRQQLGGSEELLTRDRALKFPPTRSPPRTQQTQLVWVCCMLFFFSLKSEVKKINLKQV